MDFETCEITWHVAPHGYGWLEPLPRDGPDTTASRMADALGMLRDDDPVLEENTPEEATGQPREYRPLDVLPPLYRQFADTPPTPDAIRAFADRYGSLVTGSAKLSAWRAELDAMHSLVRLFDLCAAEDRVALARHVRWDPDYSRVMYHSTPPGFPRGAAPPLREGRNEVIAVGEPEGTPLDRLSPPDVLLPAVLYLQWRANDRLRHHESAPALLWHPDTDAVELGFRPTSLAGALWLQFARAVSGRFRYRPCRQCGRWIRLTPDEARTNRRTCSRACQNKLFRARQARAADLHRAGVDPAVIAAEVETDEATVRNWVKAAGGKPSTD